MESYDGDAMGLVLAKNPIATRPTNTLVGRGLEMVEAEESQEEAFRKKCFEFLAEEGYRPKISEESRTINFKKSGVTYFIDFFGNPQTLFMIYTFKYYGKTRLSRILALEIANESNIDTGDAKVSVMNDSQNEYDRVIIFQSECHIPAAFEGVLYNKIDAIQDSISLFQQRVLKLTKSAK